MHGLILRYAEIFCWVSAERFSPSLNIVFSITHMAWAGIKIKRGDTEMKVKHDAEMQQQQRSDYELILTGY